MNAFADDPVNPGWVLGWGVYRMSPWAFAGVFDSEAEAGSRAQALGNFYQVAFGSHRLGSDDFVTSTKQIPPKEAAPNSRP
jgi:hypothetical protein